MSHMVIKDSEEQWLNGDLNISKGFIGNKQLTQKTVNKLKSIVVSQVWKTWDKLPETTKIGGTTASSYMLV